MSKSRIRNRTNLRFIVTSLFVFAGCAETSNMEVRNSEFASAYYNTTHSAYSPHTISNKNEITERTAIPSAEDHIFHINKSLASQIVVRQYIKDLYSFLGEAVKPEAGKTEITPVSAFVAVHERCQLSRNLIMSAETQSVEMAVTGGTKQYTLTSDTVKRFTTRTASFKANKFSRFRAELDSLNRLHDAVIEKEKAHRTYTVPDTASVSAKKVIMLADTIAYSGPGRVISFETQCYNGVAELIWTTTPISDILKFIVERSTDLVKWTEASTVPVQNTGRKITRYSVTDNYSSETSVFYRLKQIDRKNNAIISPCVKASCQESKKLEISCFPDPCTDKLLISYKNCLAHTASIQIYDLHGKLVTQKYVPAADIDRGGTLFSVSNLKPGNYTVTVISGQVKKSVSFVRAG